jgi:hypothetical protein
MDQLLMANTSCSSTRDISAGYPSMKRALMRKKLRVLGLEPRTYGLKESSPEHLTTSQSDTYTPAENNLTANLTEKDDASHQNLTRIVNRWPSLPENVRQAIMIVIGED